MHRQHKYKYVYIYIFIYIHINICIFIHIYKLINIRDISAYDINGEGDPRGFKAQ
jgi:hypothetical protein